MDIDINMDMDDFDHPDLFENPQEMDFLHNNQDIPDNNFVAVPIGAEVSFGGRMIDETLNPDFDPAQLTPDYLHGLLDEITDSVYKPSLDLTTEPIGNASWNLAQGHEWINVNYGWLAKQVNQHGTGVINVFLGHEVGHSLVQEITEQENWSDISDWHHELGADFVAGVVVAREGIDPEIARHFLCQDEALYPCVSHPDGILRTGAMMKGYDWATEHFANVTPTTNLVEEYLTKIEFRNEITSELHQLFKCTPYVP